MFWIYRSILSLTASLQPTHRADRAIISFLFPQRKAADAFRFLPPRDFSTVGRLYGARSLLPLRGVRAYFSRTALSDANLDKKRKILYLIGLSASRKEGEQKLFPTNPRRLQTCGASVSGFPMLQGRNRAVSVYFRGQSQNPFLKQACDSKRSTKTDNSILSGIAVPPKQEAAPFEKSRALPRGGRRWRYRGIVSTLSFIRGEPTPPKRQEEYPATSIHKKRVPR